VANQQIRTHVHRPAASRTWEHTHKWGSSFGDSTDLRVTRTDGGPLRIAYGRESIEIREELVAVLAEMVATAAEWSDTRDLPPGVQS
jgi:hypothetical protein